MFWTERLARTASRRPRAVLGIWIAVIIAAVVAIAALLPTAIGTGRSLYGTDFKRGQDLLAQRFPGSKHSPEVVIVRSKTLTVEDVAVRGAIEGLTRQIDATGKAQVANVYTRPRNVLLSPDKRATTL